MPIHILSDDVVSQIAAGEVVERPASVVKELLENSLDAGATEIRIKLEQAGRQKIEVDDNGGGIAGSEMELAVARHCTSKLSIADDLFRIQTLGFRGEALASMASVSHFTLISRPGEQETGFRLTVEDAKVLSKTPVGAVKGTIVEINDLFYNVPARLKFLKSDQTERQQVYHLVSRYALAYPNVRFSLELDGAGMFQTHGSGDRREVLSQIHGLDIAKQMLEVDFEINQSNLTGYISPTNLTRSNRREIIFFVNGRWIQDVSLTTALVQAYHTLLMVGRYPMAFLMLQLPLEEVDVNVHPAKSEVRFRRQDDIFSFVQRGVRRALLAYSPVPSFSPSRTWAGVSTGSDPVNGFTFPARVEADPTKPTAGVPEERPSSPLKFPGGLPLLRLVGQVGSTYVVAEGPDGLYLIDQHAAHERVLFEKFKKQLKSNLPSQSLLEPVVFQLPRATAQMLNGQMEVLKRIGFDLEEFGAEHFRLRAIPALLIGVDPVAAVKVVVEDFEEDETPLQNEVEARLVARVCKRAAVKAGKVLSHEEQIALLHDLENCESPRTCPHGRPTMIHLSVDLLERQFGRKGAR